MAEPGDREADIEQRDTRAKSPGLPREPDPDDADDAGPAEDFLPAD